MVTSRVTTISTFVDYYKLLGLQSSATAVDVRRAYLRLAKKHHPDVGGTVAFMQRLNEAYTTLQGPARVSYDHRYQAQYGLERVEHEISAEELDTDDWYAAGTGYEPVVKKQAATFGSVMKFATVMAGVAVVGFFIFTVVGAVHKSAPVTSSAVTPAPVSATPSAITGIQAPAFTVPSDLASQHATTR